MVATVPRAATVEITPKRAVEMKRLALAVAALLTTSACAETDTEADETTTETSPAASESAATPDESGSGAGGRSAGWTGPQVLGRDSDDWQVDVISDDLTYPWEVRVSRGVLFVTEVGGTIARFEDGDRERSEVRTSDPVVHDGGSGLLGFALAPDFERSGTAYAYYTYENTSGTGGLANRVVELSYRDQAWTEERVLIDAIPGHELYNGGRIAIGPDGHLYVTTGWVHDEKVSQDPDSLAGKILRITTDGEPAPGNPFGDSPVYTLGHRNPQGLAWDAQGRLFSTEHGETGHDEINLIEAGNNYGWPLVEGDETRDGMTTPYLDSGSSAWAPSGTAFAGGELLVSALGDEVLYVLDDEAATLEGVFSSDERVRTVLPVGDELYLTTTNTSPRGGGEENPDRLIRLRAR